MKLVTNNPMKKPLSRQRLFQIKWHKEGRCVICGKPIINKTHCQKHAEMERRMRSGHPERVYRTKYSEPLSHGIGGTIRMVRLQKGLKSGLVAKLSGRSQGMISKLEYDGADPSFRNLQSIASALGLKLSELIALHEERVGEKTW